MAVLRRWFLTLFALLLCAVRAPAQEVAGARAHRTIQTTVPAAAAGFDRGLLMLYAFNIGEARDAFRAAERADPQATLLYFGEALAETIDINRPTTPDGERRAADAIVRGEVAAARAPADERALFAAIASRFAAKVTQKERFTAYFRALQAFVTTHPEDGMASTLAAYAGWNATDRITAGAADELTADGQLMADDLDRALTLDAGDVGAHHLRIHFWEAAHRPQRALSDADYLSGLRYAPGESHLAHMAGHIYDRVGDYAQMIAVNRNACTNDDGYFAHGHGEGQTYMRAYHAHDVDFVLYGLTTLGRNAEARAFAARDSDYSREVVALRIHDDRSVLTLLGAAITPMRVIAEARSGDVDAAHRDLSAIAATANNDADIAIATAILARARHDDPAAIAAYRKALLAAGSDLGDPKTHWSTPIAEGLGATLLEAREPVDAERVFSDELDRYPNDPRLEFGLAQALAAQGKPDAAAHAAYVRDWKGDKPLTPGDLG